jgi:hypothetical protein
MSNLNRKKKNKRLRNVFQIKAMHPNKEVKIKKQDGTT